MSIKNKKIIALVHHDFEDLELWYPIYRCREAGAIVHLIGEKASKKYIGKYGVPAVSDFSFDAIDPKDYDAILVPGGWAPDKIRRFTSVINMLTHMHEHKKPIGQICHAGWVLISAKILNGVKVTSTPGIKDDMENAGAIWVDQPAIADGHIISAQRPADLPEYMKLYLNAFE